MQHIAIFARDGGAQHPICCQYLQGFDRDLLVVKNRARWALKTAQNRCENASKLPKIALNRSILDFGTATPHWVDIQYMSTFASDWAGSTFNIIDSICKGAASISNTNICSGIVNKLPEGYTGPTRAWLGPTPVRRAKHLAAGRVHSFAASGTRAL